MTYNWKNHDHSLLCTIVSKIGRLSGQEDTQFLWLDAKITQ